MPGHTSPAFNAVHACHPRSPSRHAGSQNAVVLKTPKSGRSFWDLGDFEADFENSRRRALPLLRVGGMGGQPAAAGGRECCSCVLHAPE